MSIFQKRIESKVRINELEKAFIKTIENFQKKDKELTIAEVGAVMLKMLTNANNNEINNQ